MVYIMRSLESVGCLVVLLWKSPGQAGGDQSPCGPGGRVMVVAVCGREWSGDGCVLVCRSQPSVGHSANRKISSLAGRGKCSKNTANKVIIL